jgi:glycosyltransferase involved in cell wall biosynthesis
VRDLQTGLIVPPGDADTLAAALSGLVTDAQLRRRLGDGARALILEQYDAAKNAAAILDLLLEVCGARA